MKVPDMLREQDFYAVQHLVTAVSSFRWVSMYNRKGHHGGGTPRCVTPNAYQLTTPDSYTEEAVRRILRPVMPQLERYRFLTRITPPDQHDCQTGRLYLRVSPRTMAL